MLFCPHIFYTTKETLDIKSLQEADNNITMAIATSGIRVNIDFMFDHVPIKQYFKKIISSSNIEKGKPDPGFFLKTAEVLVFLLKIVLFLKIQPLGVQSAKAAKMKVVALTATHSKDELKEADIVIKDYTEIGFKKLLSIM